MEHPRRLVLLSPAGASAPAPADVPVPGRWRLADGLMWRSWDNELVVYDDRSGDTHRLTQRSAAVFLALQSQASAGGSDGLDAEVIDGLAGLGLVERQG
jgi:hypothetical protein